MFIHSDKGTDLLNNLSGQLELIETSVENVHKENTSFIESSKSYPDRNEFLEQVIDENFEDLIKNIF